MQKLLGRQDEKYLLVKALQSNKSEMLAVLGRRRVGKTYLINQVYKKLDFESTGILNATRGEQLENFWNKLKEYTTSNVPIAKPKNWLQAFLELKLLLKEKKTNRKKIVFIDELPWMETPKSKFVDALGHFWNDYAVKNNVVIVLCGSAASWMIKNIVHNKGGLHNRITQLIHVHPFTLKETEQFLRSKNIVLNRNQITQVYMVMGGIPLYLDKMESGKSLAQNIDAIFFQKNSFLKDEFKILFRSLFDNPTNHITIIKALASKWKGMTRNEILRITKLTDGGAITNILEELETAAFITTVMPFGKKKKDMLYRLCDCYILFYTHFIEQYTKTSKSIFNYLEQSPKWHNWCGYAFENICLAHLDNIQKSLGISTIYSEASSWIIQGNQQQQQGAQIDLLIDRADNVINLCEIKFYDNPFLLTKAYLQKLKEKQFIFKQHTKTKKTIFLTMITSNGLVTNTYSKNNIQNSISLDELF
jgi:uncharacterized protein